MDDNKRLDPVNDPNVEKAIEEKNLPALVDYMRKLYNHMSDTKLSNRERMKYNQYRRKVIRVAFSIDKRKAVRIVLTRDDFQPTEKMIDDCMKIM